MISLGIVVSTLQFLGVIEHAVTAGAQSLHSHCWLLQVHINFQRATKDLLECCCVFELPQQRGQALAPSVISEVVVWPSSG